MFKLFKKKEIKKENSAEKVEKKTADIKKEISKNVNIYSMPERFKNAHKEKNRAKTVGMFIIIGGAIFLIAASAAAYYYFFSGRSAKNELAPAIKEQPTDNKKEAPIEKSQPVEQIEVQKQPKESFREMKKEFDNVLNFAGYEAAILKYGSKNRISEFEKEKNQYGNTEDSFKENIASLLVRTNMPKLSEIGEINLLVKGNTATLSMSTVDLNKNGTVLMVLEGDDWKLESESWEDIKIEKTTGAVFQTGTDLDGDGLTDKEENILGSNASDIDSDGDSYGDFGETMSFYDPAGPGKLIDNIKIKKYSNDTYGYTLLYPVDFSLSEIGGDDSLIFRSSDNHFIQLISQINQEKLSISKWYERQFDSAKIETSRIIVGSGWQGIKSEDGLIIYLVDNKLQFIFTFVYNLGEQNVLEYKNIFEMMVKSFDVQSDL